MAWWQLNLGSGRASQPRGPEAAAWTESEVLESILSERVTFRAPATLLMSDWGRTTSARFAVLSDGEIRFDLASLPASLRIEPLASCCVTFVHRRHAMVFLSQVLRVDPGSTPENPRQVALRVPSRMASEDLRSAPRIPNLRGSGMVVLAEEPGGRRWTSIPLNVSATGALVEFPESAVPRFRHGAEIQLVIEHGEISARVAATVRRVDGPRIAFTFPGALHGAATVAPKGLDEILRRLRAPRLGTASTLTA